MNSSPLDFIASAKLVVIKIGSVLLVDADGNLKTDWLASLARDVRDLRDKGKSVLIVTSGSIAMGRKAMGISSSDRPSSIPLERKQAAAAAGQVMLMAGYASIFEKSGMNVAQILVTRSDTEDRRPHLNARATIHALLDQGIIPVVNENDTVSTAEIRFGDNDRLASRVAQMIGADLIIQLSTSDGLYTADPRLDPTAKHISVVEKLSPEHLEMAGDAVPGLSTGGMKSKLEAARIATESGIHMIITKGTEAHPLKNLCQGESKATLFLSSGQPRSARQKWILAHVKPKGVFMIDEGACNALKADKSLLPAGVCIVEGNFGRGDAVILKDMSGKTIATGLSAYDSESARSIAGHKSAEIAAILGYSRGEEMIHRDDLVLNS